MPCQLEYIDLKCHLLIQRKKNQHEMVIIKKHVTNQTLLMHTCIDAQQFCLL